MSIKVHGSHFESSVKHRRKISSKQYVANTNQLSAVVRQIQHNWYLSLCDKQDSSDIPFWFDDEEFYRKQAINQETMRVCDLQNLLSESQSVIVYLRSLDRYSGLLVNKNRLQHFDVGSITDVDSKIVDYIELLSCSAHKNINNDHTIVNKLFPVEVINHVKSTLTVAALGKLCEIPYFSFIDVSSNASTKSKKGTRNNKAMLDTKGFLQVEHFESICNKECLKALNQNNQSDALSTIIQDGAKIRIKSIWDIPEEAAQSFVQSFYHALSESNRAQLAFQTAIETMAKKYGQDRPYYWAGFTMFKA
jgi:hypothetical protein